LGNGRAVLRKRVGEAPLVGGASPG
jgi:hypothetical protein